MTDTQWPSWARPLTEDEQATMEHLERVYKERDDLSERAIILIAALQGIWRKCEELYTDPACRQPAKLQYELIAQWAYTALAEYDPMTVGRKAK